MYVDHPTACIDHVPNSPYGGIDLPPDEFYQEHALSSRHPPSPRTGLPNPPDLLLGLNDRILTYGTLLDVLW